MRLHGPDLHRRGVRAQHDVLVDVERVRRLPGGVHGVVVERVEVVVDGVDLRALDDAEAEAQERVLELAPDRVDEVQAADREGRRAGQRDVEHVGGQPGVELRALELGLARLHRGLERPARLVGGAADGAALLRRQLGDAAQHVRQLGLAAQEAHPGLLERVGAGRPGDRRLALGPELCDAVDHRAAILVFRPRPSGGGAGRGVQGDGRRHRGIQGLGRDRNVRDVVTRGDNVVRQAFALRPDDQGEGSGVGR